MESFKAKTREEIDRKISETHPEIINHEIFNAIENRNIATLRSYIGLGLINGDNSNKYIQLASIRSLELLNLLLQIESNNPAERKVVVQKAIDLCVYKKRNNTLNALLDYLHKFQKNGN
jgi:hypothetical protein